MTTEKKASTSKRPLGTAKVVVGILALVCCSVLIREYKDEGITGLYRGIGGLTFAAVAIFLIAALASWGSVLDRMVRKHHDD